MHEIMKMIFIEYMKVIDDEIEESDHVNIYLINNE